MTFRHILHVVGARPNFMKVAPLMRALSQHEGTQQTLVHTGQHYDANMSHVFFKELDLPEPDVNLEVGSGTHSTQTAQIMMRFEEYVLARRPDLVLVYGDVNSTVAAALVCAKLLIPVGHVEAGLRSFDRTMPEEVNRLLTDQIAELLFTPSADGEENLAREGVPADKIHLVGNVMIDSLIRLLPRASERWENGLLERLIPRDRERPGARAYALVTLHRPSNVDEPEALGQIMAALAEISRDVTVVFPIHPRTRAAMDRHHVSTLEGPKMLLIDPLPYLDFVALERHATFVITDSGGIQEETTYLGIPCLTVRENTERPVTVSVGTNILIGRDMERLKLEVARILAGDAKRGSVPPLWDGRAAERIASVIQRSSSATLPSLNRTS